MPSLGLYLHLPFCRSRCAYCAFYTRPYDAGHQASYVAALCREIETVARCGRKAGPYQVPPQGGRQVATLFLGGGTPSLLSAVQLEEVMTSLREAFAMDRCREITLEANPETVTPDSAALWRRSGIQRLSIGAQSFQDDVLRRLGRHHGAARTRDAVAAARQAGFADISLDIIAGVQGDALMADLQAAIDLQPDHISMYLLEVTEEETGAATVLARQAARGRARIPDEDWFAGAYSRAVELLARSGLQRYEISNFARPGHRSRHNLRYWRNQEVLGLGVASHSLLGGQRHGVAADLDAYLEADGAPDIHADVTRSEERLAEAWILGLRLERGISAREVAMRTGQAQVEIPLAALQPALAAGLVRRRGERLFLSERGILLSNEVFQLFLP